MVYNVCNNLARRVVTRRRLIAFAGRQPSCIGHKIGLMEPVAQRSLHLSPLCRNNAAATTATSNATSTASTATATTAAMDKTDPSTKKSKKKEEKNILLDNLGTIFLTTIALIIAYLVRSFLGSTARNRLRDELEERAELDPLEIDELRRVNPGLTAAVFRSLLHEMWSRHPQGQMTYDEFAETIRELLVRQHKIPTIEYGHLLDRVVLHVLESQGESSAAPQSISLWMTVLSLALNAPIRDRMRVLYEILSHEQDQVANSVEASSDMSGDSIMTTGSSTTATDPVATVRLDQVRRLVRYLQATDQLVIETQLFPTKEEAYPVQQYHQGSPEELVQWSGSDSEPIDADAMASILRSRSVCAWGECYR